MLNVHIIRVCVTGFLIICVYGCVARELMCVCVFQLLFMNVKMCIAPVIQLLYRYMWLYKPEVRQQEARTRSRVCVSVCPCVCVAVASVQSSGAAGAAILLVCLPPRISRTLDIRCDSHNRPR